MKRQMERRASINRLAAAGLLAVLVLSAGCQPGNAGNGNATGSDGRAANSRTGGAPTPAEQTNATTVNAGHRPADDAGGMGAGRPSIEITLVPHRGSGGPDVMEKIAGRVSGVNAKECKVVLFVYSDKWYVQPYFDSPYTTIEADNKWENDTHLGSVYAALLVRNSYKPPDTTGTLPGVGGDVLAVARADGVK